MRWFYSFCLYLITPYLLFRLWWKGRKLPAYKERIKERFMLDNPPLMDIDIWVHAVSLGEVIAVSPLVDELLQQNKKILITTMTPTGAERVQQYFGDKLLHRYIPYDLGFALKCFFNRVKPKLGLIVETELWPNLIHFATKAKIPLILINARLSQKSFQGYKKIRFLIKLILRKFNQILVQTADDAKRFITLGALTKDVKVLGNMKFDLKTKHINSDIFLTLKNHWGAERPILIAASTHHNEEELLFAILHKLKKDIPELILLIAPRHPERFQEIYQQSLALGFQTGLRSQIESLTEELDVVVIDSLGELLGFYQISDYAFVGGSFVPVGGHNVLEPIAVKIPVFTGPYIQNFKAICKELEAAEAICIVENKEELVEKILVLQKNPNKRMKLIHNASTVLEKNKGSVGRYLQQINHLLANKK